MSPTRRELDQLRRLAGQKVAGASRRGVDEELIVPDIIEFVCSDRYLARPNLYPRQATFLKLIFLQDHLFTDYDHQVIEEWSAGFKLPEAAITPTYNAEGDVDVGLRYQGQWGCQPDIYERIQINKAAGRRWFRENVVVIGRRGSKNHLGALCGAYVLWHYVQLGDPQGHYGLDRDKRLAAMVFANKKEHARANQWRDLTQVILGGPCFKPFICRPLGESLKVFAKHDWDRIACRRAAGIDFDPEDMATFVLEPREATLMGGRGPAAFCLFFDEMAHVVASSGSARSAEEVYGAAVPALEQFGYDAFINEPSSPWQMMGQFHQNWLNALEVTRDTHRPVYPEMFTIQLESWDIYKDWERATEIPMYPGGPRFQELRSPVISYDSNMRRAERANPEGFAVEHRARWAAATDAYLNREKVTEMFRPWPTEDRVLEASSNGLLATRYVAHADPSKSGANFALAIAHTEGPDDNGLLHVVYDQVTHWEPGDFEGNIIDYLAIEEELKGYVQAFMPSHFSFDQWNSVALIQRLQAWIGQKRFPKRVMVFERTATKDQNWKVAETFKTALNLGLIHAPYYELAELELTYLQDTGNNKVDHPSTGPVRTKDVFDAMANVAYAFIGEQMASYTGQAFSDVPLTGALPGGLPHSGPTSRDEAVHEQLRNFSKAQRFHRAAASPTRRTTRGPYGGHHWSPPLRRRP